MTKRKPITSVDETRKVLLAADKEIVPPKHIKLDELELDEFNAIIAEHPKCEWTNHKLSMAAMLAQAIADVIHNPKQKGASGIRKDIISLRRSLGIHAKAQHGNARNMATRMAIAKDIESRYGFDGEEDNFIARPTDLTKNH